MAGESAAVAVHGGNASGEDDAAASEGQGEVGEVAAEISVQACDRTVGVELAHVEDSLTVAELAECCRRSRETATSHESIWWWRNGKSS